MYNDVSLELRNKIRTSLEIDMDVIYSHSDYSGRLFFKSQERYLWEECKTWLSVITTYFKTTYYCYRLKNVGRYLGIRPIGITYDFYDGCHVEFEIEDLKNESWKDWFDLTGESDGPLLGIIGKVLNERTCPEYYASK
jgi:hypothetical protein